jgi:ribosomal protein S18 acetylase RimI-like enzyme
MTIRDTTVEDAAAVASMIDLVARERRFLAGTVGFSEEATRDFIAQLRSADAVHVVAELDGSLVGWCDISPLPFEGMHHVGRLGMGVKRDFRGRGIGRRLLEAALLRGFGRRFERVELEVFSSNQKAVQLYESFGFLLEGKKRAARKLDGICDDLLIYAKLKEA